jgi:ribose-phosphate pyrophosphokinase
VENVSLAITIRQKQGNNISVNIIGEIQDKHCVIVDDIIDTAGRITTASETLLEARSLLALLERKYRY